MDAAQDEAFRERIRRNWTDPQTVAAWRRWHGAITEQMQSVSSALIAAARIRPGMDVLDLASGSGEPALQIAAVVAPGSVVATDLSDSMLDIARENARAAQLTNVTFAACDAESLPFDDGAFDAVTSRMGAMFFVDLGRSLAEIQRVLKPGGRVAFAAWGPLDEIDHFWTMLGPFAKRAEMPVPPPDVPHPFRFAKPGSLERALFAAGFVDVREERSRYPLDWHGTPEQAWEMYDELAAPPFIDEMPDDEKQAAIGEVLEALRAMSDGPVIRANGTIVIASAAAP